MLKFRTYAQKILTRILAGEHFLLTYRGKPVAELKPLVEQKAGSSDSFYRLTEIAQKNGRSLSNKEMDKLIYEN